MLLIQLSPNPNPYLRKFLNCSAPYSIEFQVGEEKGGLVALVDGTNEYFGERRGGIAAAGKKIKLTYL